MKTVAIVQSRVGSTRLPGKALLELAGQPMILFMLERIKQSKTLSQIVVATGVGRENDALEKTVRKAGFEVFRGSEDYVLAHYAGAARLHKADIIVRLTGDCPLMDPKMVDRLVQEREKGGYDYVTNVKPPTWPDGLDVSVFTRKLLEDADRQATKKSDREHVVPWMWRMTPLEGGTQYKSFNVASPKDLSAHRWTVDEPSDYEFMKRIVSELGTNRIRDAHLEDILSVLARKPELSAFNNTILRDQGYLNALKSEKFKT